MSNSSIVVWKDVPNTTFLEFSNKKELKNKITGKIYSFSDNNITSSFRGELFHFNKNKLYDLLFETDCWKEIIDFPEYQMNNKALIRYIYKLKLIMDRGDNGKIILLQNGTYKITNRGFIYEKLWLVKEQWKYYKEIEELNIKYPNFSEQFEHAYSFYPYERDSLFIISHPQLIEEFSENNKDSIGMITHGSITECIWKCKKHKEYKLKISYRTCTGAHCPECTEEENDHRNNITEGTNIESWFEEELINKNVNAIQQDNNNSIADIIVILNGKQYAIQCKTLICRAEKYKISVNRNHYPDNLLIVATNRERNKFTYLFGKDIIYLSAIPISNDNIVDSKDLFLSKIIELIPQSFIIDDILKYMTEDNKKEYLMKERLKKKCKELGLEYKKFKNNIDPIDCFINNVPCQLKFSSGKRATSHYIPFHKSVRCETMPYSADDGFELLITEIADYENEFFIMNKNDLIKYGYISTKDQKGKVTLTISNPNNVKHRFHYCWNNFKLLK